MMKVLFDLGGTLLEVSDPVEVIGSFLTDEGTNKTPDEISAAVSAADASFGEDDFIGPNFWFEWNKRVLSELGIMSGRDRLARMIDRSWFKRAKVTPFPEAIDVLEELKDKGTRIGVVTNGTSSDMVHLVDEPGLSPYVDARVSADLVGRRKPNPRIFLHAARELGSPPSEILFVGDDVDLDYRPAEALGMQAVLVNRGRGRPLVRNVIRDLRGVLGFL